MIPQVPLPPSAKEIVEILSRDHEALAKLAEALAGNANAMRALIPGLNEAIGDGTPLKVRRADIAD